MGEEDCDIVSNMIIVLKGYDFSGGRSLYA